MSQPTPPALAYWRIAPDEEGVSRQHRCVDTDFHLESIAPGAAAQWQGPSSTSERTVMFTVLPSGWRGDWHENPHPQWIIPLSGRWFVESMDGVRIEFGPGEASYGADQGCRERDGRRGHLSGTVGEAPAVLMLVQDLKAQAGEAG